jgi:hypothetical protein
MDNTIAMQKFAETIAFNTKEQLPILEGTRINKTLSDKLDSGSGSTVDVLVPGVNNVIQGAAADPSAAINVQNVPVAVNQWNISAPYDLRESTLELNTFETQVSKPNAIKLASSVNTAIFNTVGGGACNGQIVTSLADLAAAIGVVDSSRIGDEKSAMINPIGAAKIIHGGPNGGFGFQANPSRGMKLYEGVIGEYFDCDVFKSPDASTITGVTVTGTVTAGLQDGSTSFIVNGITAGTVIPAGTPLQVQGVYSTDAFGNRIGSRTFITTAAVTATGSGDLLPIGIIRDKAGSWPIPNTDLSQAGTAIAGILTAGTIYATGLVMASNAGAFASIIPSPYPGITESVATRVAGELNVRASIYSDLTSGISRWRFDILYGVSSLYGNGANMIYIPM